MVCCARPSGIESVPELPWGSHFCQFYRSADDMLGTLTPFFRAGLEGGEFCVWVTSQPVSPDDALAALRRDVPDFDEYLDRGQFEIHDYRDWYLAPPGFDAERTLQAWEVKYQSALDRGYAGMRLTGNTLWLERHQWHAFLDYEASVNSSFGDNRIIGLCTYSLERCAARDVLDVVRAHQFALVTDGEHHRLLHQDAVDTAHRELTRANEKLRALASEISRAERRERRKLAHVLHEDLQQVIAAAKLQLEAARRRLGDAADPHLDAADRTLAQAIDLTRGLASELSPPLLQHAGLAAALDFLARHFRKQYGLSVDAAADPQLAEVRGDTAEFLFSATRELLFNVVKHAGVDATTLRASRSRGGMVQITVEDHGRGCDSASLAAQDGEPGFGLYAIRERLRLLGGHLNIESPSPRRAGDHQTGCRITIACPVV